MQREMNYQESVGTLQALAAVIGKGDSPVKTPLRTTYENLDKVVKELTDALDDNFEKYITRGESGDPILKDSTKVPQGAQDYVYSDEKAFTKKATELMENKVPVEFATVKKDRKVITNNAEYPLDEFLEFSSVVSTDTAYMLQEYFIEK
jgi:hypothetical protein